MAKYRLTTQNAPGRGFERYRLFTTFAKRWIARRLGLGIGKRIVAAAPDEHCPDTD